MENLRFGVWFMIVMLVQGSEAHSLHTEQEPVCTSRSSYNLLMRTKMIKIEREIRDAVHSLTDQVLHCSDEDCPESQPEVKSCPDGSYKHGQSCYFFSDDTLTWADAIEKCMKDFGGYLAVVTDSDENEYLKTIARGPDRIWIGGSDAFKEGEWRWTATMERVTSSHFTDWYTAAGQPDNGSGTEHCAELVKSYDYKWNDDECYTPHYYVCEKNL